MPIDDALAREIWRECHRLKMTTDGREHAEAHALANWVMAKMSHRNDAAASGGADSQGAAGGATDASATAAYAEGRGDQFEDDCAVVRRLFENLDDEVVMGDGFINTTRVRELLDHFDVPTQVECSGLECSRPECEAMGCTADRISDERERRIASATKAPAGRLVPGRFARDVLAERRRQVEVEGWTPEHDDEHGEGEMALAAAAYAVVDTTDATPSEVPAWWPWDAEWWKRKDRRSNLIRATALLLAEGERLDRAQPVKPVGGSDG